MTPKVSVVIRCFNEEKHIGKLLTGILDQSLKEAEIVVVDSGSTDATVAIASQFRIKLVSIKPEEFSFGYSLNQGCAMATGEFIVIASAHVYPVYEDWLQSLIAPFQDAKVALTYGKQRGNDLTRFSEHQIFARWFPETAAKQNSHPFCNNANAAIRRALWAQQQYDETLTGLEDLDWAKRILTAGYSIQYVPQAEVIHVHEETPQKILNRYRREAIALKNIFPEQHFGLLDFMRLSVTNILSDYFHALRDGVFWRNFVEIPRFRLMQFWGTYRGFRLSGPVGSDLRETFYYPRSLKRQEASSDEDRKRIDYSTIRHTHE